MARVVLEASDAEFEAWFRTTPECRRATLGIASDIARAAALNSTDSFYTGRYQASWRARPLPAGAAEVVNDDGKAILLERGTGIYGPKRRPIRAKRRMIRTRAHTRHMADGRTVQVKRSKPRPAYMIFRPYGQTNRFPTAPTQDLGGLVFAKEVKGQRATHNGERAAREIALQRGLRFVASKDLR